MKFVNPTILWALFFGLTPIIIYYLMRYRSIREPWGANYVLERALDRLRKRWYLDQLILIILRVLACLLLIFAFARPLSESRSEDITGTGRHHVIVADASYSMLAGKKAETRWDRSKTAMKKLVGRWGRGEKWSLLLLGHGADAEGEAGGQWVVKGAHMTSQEKAKARIDDLQPGQHDSSIHEALQKVQSAYGDQKMDVYLFSGDQATAWKGFEDLSNQLQRGIVQDSSGRAVPVFWVNPPLDDYDNIAVTEVRPASEVMLNGQMTRVFVKVENFGAEPRQGVNISLLVDGRTVGSETTSLLPGQSRWAYLDYTPEKVGSHSLTARVGKDTLEYDNEMSAGCESREKVSVLVLADSDDPAKFQSVWGFLGVMSRSLQSLKSPGEGASGPVQFALSSDKKIEKNLDGYDVVMVDGAKTMTAEVASQLRSWAQHGGLILMADEGIDRQAWNNYLGEADLLPAALRGIQAENFGGDAFQSLARTQLGNSPFRVFETKDMGDVSKAKIYVWRTLHDLKPQSEEWMTYDDQTTFIAEKPVRPGTGRVILLTSGLSGRNSNLVVRKFYIPMLYQLVKAAAGGSIYSRTIDLGDDLVAAIRNPENIRGITFNQKGENAVPLKTKTELGRAVVRRDNVSKSGAASILVIRQGGTSRIWFGVQGPRDDSNLRPISDKLRTRLTQSDQVKELSGWKELEKEMRGISRGAEWHHWVLVALLVVFVAEMFLERRFV